MAIGISLASYLPWSAVFATRTAQWAKDAGYEFLQVVPFRTTERFSGLQQVVPVRYVERAWNPFYREEGKDPLTPITLYDRLFFPSPQECIGTVNFYRHEGATLIGHGLKDLKNEKTLLEVSPGLWLTPYGIQQLIAGTGRRLVLDLYHLRRKPRPDEVAHKPKGLDQDNNSRLGPWQEAVKLLLPLTQVIHVSPFSESDELQKFLEGKEVTELEEMLELIQAKDFRGDYVVEFTLGLPGIMWWQLKKAICRFRARLAEIVGINRNRKEV